MSQNSYSNPYRYYVLAVLFIAYVFNFVDRQVMTILIEPIKNEFGASDTQMGLLSGFAFAIFYASLGVPVARLADKWSRRNVLTISITLWSAITALCGMAANFWQMALLRIGVGVGKAGGTPPSQSLLSDYFPQEKRSLALGIYSAAPHVGVLVGLFGGAMIADAYGWRVVFVVFGLPGLLLAPILYFTVREPVRDIKPQPDAKDSLWGTVKQLYKMPTFSYISLAIGVTAISAFGLGAWAPSFLIRIHGISIVEAGLYLGLVGAFCGGIGAVLGGYICDRMAARNPVWQLRFPAISILLSLPFLMGFILWPETDTVAILGKNVPVAILFMMCSTLLAGFWVGPTYAAAQNLTPPECRAQASALLLLAFNLLGMGFGPFLIGVLSDAFVDTYGAESIRYALAWSLVTVVLGAFFFWKGSGHYRQAMEGREQEEDYPAELGNSTESTA
ncbi:spinster family MFS transporter [Endozoicomonas montiporae]|uniref:Major facilitator superfamily MFS_1 n=1 Tax=Endozoicomonas montiporae CL-33 TaxID=570277 RepID=A0A142B6S3_9GAMM|nr:MFS transporter [Endozoicomonas montiporae]AMO54449.1 major facilitator superfamily MFS_1 [Endozoicomonas montiporae CL-33]